MERLIAWGTGGGNLRITYTGEGSGTVRLESDTENLTGYPRSLTVTFRTTGGTGEKTRRLTVSQPSRKAYVSGGTLFVTNALDASVSDGTLSIEDAECKVSDNVLLIE